MENEFSKDEIKKKINEIEREIETSNRKIERINDFISKGLERYQNLNLKNELATETKKAEELLTKRKIYEDNLSLLEAYNIAFKCNWNDNGYKGICSKKAYDFNQKAKHVWCIQPENECHELIRKNKKGYPCSESRLFIDFCFGAGVHHRGPRKGQPMSIRKVREGKVAILTTREPEMKEGDRYIFGIMDINKIIDERYRNQQQEETKVFGNKDTSIIVDKKVILKFWDFHRNIRAEKSYEKFWGSGLHRYISDKEILQILISLKNKYEKLKLDIEEIRKIDNLINRFKEWVNA